MKARGVKFESTRNAVVELISSLAEEIKRKYNTDGHDEGSSSCSEELHIYEYRCLFYTFGCAGKFIIEIGSSCRSKKCLCFCGRGGPKIGQLYTTVNKRRASECIELVKHEKQH